jgi:cell division protein FtsW
MLKFAILVFTAGFLGRKASKGKLNDTHETLVPLGIVVAVSLLFIIIIQKDFGTGASLVGIVLAMLVAGGINIHNSAKILLIAVLLGGMLIISAPHRMERVMTFLKGDTVSSGDSDSYQVEQAKLAIGMGGLFGLGVGNSIQSTGYLPVANNDSVFAILGETFGFVGLITILVLFYALLMRLLQLMDHLVDIRLKLLVSGVFGWLGSHVILNVASMIGVMPLTGITLPLLSFGGTSMLFMTAALGMVFQLSHYTVHPSRLKEVKHEISGSRRGIGRSRYSGRSGITRA